MRRHSPYNYAFNNPIIFTDPDGMTPSRFGHIYFVSFAVVEWLDVFTRNEYKDILVESLSYCQKHKGMVPIAIGMLGAL